PSLPLTASSISPSFLLSIRVGIPDLQSLPKRDRHSRATKTTSFFQEPSVRTLTPLKWLSALTVKTNVINRLLKTRSIMQERQGAEREVQCLLKIGILARDTVTTD